MTTGTKVALGIAGVACGVAALLAWALCDLCSQIDEMDSDYDEWERRHWRGCDCCDDEFGKDEDDYYDHSCVIEPA